jgi:hypothetical protein
MQSQICSHIIFIIIIIIIFIITINTIVYLAPNIRATTQFKNCLSVLLISKLQPTFYSH